MKIETVSILKYILTALISIFIYIQFQPSPKPEIKYVQVEVENKSGKITRKTTTKPDGSQQIDEVHDYLSNRKSDVSISQKPADKKNMVAIIPKYNFRNNSSDLAAAYSYNGLGIYGSKSEIGLVFSFSW
jgi:hypothetical protein